MFHNCKLSDLTAISAHSTVNFTVNLTNSKWLFIWKNSTLIVQTKWEFLSVLLSGMYVHVSINSSRKWIAILSYNGRQNPYHMHFWSAHNSIYWIFFFRPFFFLYSIRVSCTGIGVEKEQEQKQQSNNGIRQTAIIPQRTFLTFYVYVQWQ